MVSEAEDDLARRALASMAVKADVDAAELREVLEALGLVEAPEVGHSNRTNIGRAKKKQRPAS